MIIASGIIVVPIIWVSLIILFSNMPMEMVADEEKLNIKVLFRENAIRYSDIARINLDREFQKATTRGEHDGYYEKLIITDINNNEYVYCRKLDLDYDAIAKNPAYLASQFENSEFAKLQRYIEERIPIMNAEKI
ncbi:hypothetical protein [Ruminococcus albus]|uniref:hypothetical protein n=1 Tax=Ruminococcus albus TaxID=1264 RepID=UPI001A9A4F62|nr:hypothetical protein [Ruminococcus albus]